MKPMPKTPDGSRGPIRPGADEYEGISIPLAPMLSLACFAAALGSRYVIGALPPELLVLPRVFLSALAASLFALVGMLLALLGLRSPSGRGMARLGLAVNGVVFVLSLLLIAAFFAIFPEPLRLLTGR